MKHNISDKKGIIQQNITDKNASYRILYNTIS
jgi:hypothetical protein